MNEHKVWEREIKNSFMKIIMFPMVIILTIILMIVAGVVFIASIIVGKIESKNKKKRP